MIYFSQKKALWIGIILVILGCCFMTCFSNSAPNLPGGEFPIDLNSNDVQKPIALAIDAIYDDNDIDNDTLDCIEVLKVTGQVVAGMIYNVHLRLYFTDNQRQEKVVQIFRNLQGEYQVRVDIQNTSLRRIGERKEIGITKEVLLLAGYAFAYHEMKDLISQKLQLEDIEKAYKQVVAGEIFDIVLRVKSPASNSITHQYLIPVKVWRSPNRNITVVLTSEKYWVPPTYSTSSCPSCSSKWKQLSRKEYMKCIRECEKTSSQSN